MLKAFTMRKARRKIKTSWEVLAALTRSVTRERKCLLLSKKRELSSPKTVESWDMEGVAGGDSMLTWYFLPDCAHHDNVDG